MYFRDDGNDDIARVIINYEFPWYLLIKMSIIVW